MFTDTFDSFYNDISMQKWGRTRDCDEEASNVHVLQTEFFMRHLFRPTHDKIATFQLEICKPAKQGMKAQ